MCGRQTLHINATFGSYGLSTNFICGEIDQMLIFFRYDVAFKSQVDSGHISCHFFFTFNKQK